MVAGPSKQFDGLVQGRDGVAVVCREIEQVPDGPLALADTRVVRELSVERQRLLQQNLAPVELLSADHAWKGRVVDGIGQLTPVIAGTSQVQALVIEGLCRRYVTLPVGDSASRLQRAGSRIPILTAARHRKDQFQARPALVEMAAHLPETPERSREPHRAIGVVVSHTPIERCPEVVVVQLEAIEPHLLVLTKKVGSSRRRQRAEGIGMTVANDVRLTTLLKTLPCVLADRLEHEQPRFREIWQPAQEAVVGQLVET